MSTRVEQEKHDCEALKPKTRDRAKFNMKTLNALTHFTRAVNVSLGRPASEATFALTRHLIQVHATLSRSINQIANV
jgi:hypothetical protein